jgi:hypothetical protein
MDRLVRPAVRFRGLRKPTEKETDNETLDQIHLRQRRGLTSNCTDSPFLSFSTFRLFSRARRPVNGQAVPLAVTDRLVRPAVGSFRVEKTGKENFNATSKSQSYFE